MRKLPQGTVTLVFTDIEGSTRLLQELGREPYIRALETHRRLLRHAFTAHGGVEVEMQGDSLLFAFDSAPDAVAAAADGQRALAQHDWKAERVRVRMGLHTGEPLESEGVYAGLDVHRAARVMQAGHGGQVLISRSTADLLDSRFQLLDLGEHRLKDLIEPERLYQVGEGKFPQPKTLTGRANNLPTQPNRLIGRKRELEVITARLRADVRLLTLVGAGGIGKTRLALEAAAELLDDFRDGAWVVFFAPVTDPAAVLPSIGRALAVAEEPGETIEENLARHLQEKEQLLVLDNMEHLLGAAPAVARLLASSDRLRLLVTSRQPLRLSAENTIDLAPLLVPRAARVTAQRALAHDAVELFVERAQAASSDFELTDGNAEAVAALCTRLDGLPLAIELAAARSPVLSPHALLRRLDRALPLLTGGMRDAAARHQTLRDTIAWSHRLLSPREKRLFASLSVFTGGCRVEMAEAVCDPEGEFGGFFEGLSSLVDKSLLRRRDDPDGEPRFYFLATIREFAETALRPEEAQQVRQAHAKWFLDLAERESAELSGAQQASVAERLDIEEANLRTAFDVLLNTAPRDALRLAAALQGYWLTRGRLHEARGAVEAALARSEEEQTSERARILRNLAFLIREQGDYKRAEQLAATALDVARAAGDEVESAATLNVLAGIAMDLGELEQSGSLYAQGLEVARRVDDEALNARLLTNSAIHAALNGDFDRSMALSDEGRALCRRRGDVLGEANALMNLGTAAAEAGDPERAQRALVEAAALYRSLGNQFQIGACVESLAETALVSGEPERATLLWAAAAAANEDVGRVAMPPAEVARYDGLLARARRALGDERFIAIWAAGRALSLDDVIEMSSPSA